MKIISWNVNWIRSVAKKWFKDFVLKENPDILCIQETKSFEDQFLKDVWEIDSYRYLWHNWNRAGYAGTAIFYKKDLKVVDLKNDFVEYENLVDDWRVTEIEFEVKKNSESIPEWQRVVLVNCYFPNWWTRADWTEMLSYKLDYYDKMINYVNSRVSEWNNVIVTWDFNICHSEIDIARPKENEDSIWFLPIEREKFGQFLANWYIDVWRKFYPDKKDVYSWWSYRAWARPRNVWWRLDYFLVNKDFIENIENMEYLTDIMWSDHCPIKLEIKK